MNGNGKASRPAILAAIVAILAFATAAALFVQGDTSLQRLGLLFGLFGIVVPTLVATLKADQAASATDTASHIAQALDGGFEARVRHSLRQVRDESGAAARVHAESDKEIAARLAADHAAQQGIDTVE